MKSRYFVEAVVHSGPADRRDALVQTPLNPQNLLWHAGNSGRFDPRSLEVCEVDGERLAPVPCQIEGEVVTWIAPGAFPAGTARRFRIGFDSEDAPAMQAFGKPVFKDRIIVTDLGSELLVSQNSQELARYRYRHPWKPYFYPVNGPHGNVVRDSEAEHPHHHGLYISYGGEDCLGVNIWSEEEGIRPPLGPAGRMAHRGFERIEYGWVYGHFTQKLEYLKPDGYPFAREWRTVRIYKPSPATLIIDWHLRVEDPADTGRRRIALACRVANSMRVRDLSKRSSDGLMGGLRERPGRLVNSAGGEGELACRGGRFTWLDFSGPVGDGWDGIALFDHPQNPGALEPDAFTCREYGIFTVGHSYPAEGFARGGTAEFRYRAYIHEGDAAAGNVNAAYADFAYPCRVTLGSEIERNDEPHE